MRADIADRPVCQLSAEWFTNCDSKCDSMFRVEVWDFGNVACCSCLIGTPCLYLRDFAVIEPANLCFKTLALNLRWKSRRALRSGGNCCQVRRLEHTQRIWGKITILNGKTHYKSPFSIAMLNYQRVIQSGTQWIWTTGQRVRGRGWAANDQSCVWHAEDGGKTDTVSVDINKAPIDRTD